MLIKDALEIVGGLSEPSKMPGWSFSIPAEKCLTGAKLRQVKGSVCSTCYALKGRYSFGTVKLALMRRFDKLNHPQWVKAMAFLLNVKEGSGFFRWFDSGDIQSQEMLQKIVDVCNLTPDVSHWLPTREYGIIAAYLNSGKTFPNNLNVRVSAYMNDGPPPVSFAKRFSLTTSSTSKNNFTCPAPTQDGKCGSCRACWHKTVPNVCYQKH